MTVVGTRSSESRRVLAQRRSPGAGWSVVFVWGAVVAFGAAAGHSQTASFDGHWTLDTERSDPQLEMDGAPRDAPLDPSELLLARSGDDLEVQRVFIRDGQRRPVSWTYVCDGKPHDLPGPLGRTRSTRAKWKKEKLSVSYTLGGGPIELDVVETWSLNKKGELEILYSSRINERMLVRKEIYTKLPATEG